MAADDGREIGRGPGRRLALRQGGRGGGGPLAHPARDFSTGADGVTRWGSRVRRRERIKKGGWLFTPR